MMFWPSRTSSLRVPLLVASAVALAAGGALLLRGQSAQPPKPRPANAVVVPTQPKPDPVAEMAGHREVLDEYCVTCHSARGRAGGLSLEGTPLDNPVANAAVWEKVIRKLEARTMPPKGMPRPDAEAYDKLAHYLEASLDRAARENPNPGRAPIHRLNRTEYANSIRDVLDLDVDVKELLPPDDESDGFDNIADVLKVSPSLLEQYLSAARQISSLAVGDPATPPVSRLHRIQPDLSQEVHGEGMPLGTRGGTRILHNFPLDAEYDFRVSILRNIVGYMTGLEFPHQLEVAIDGERVFSAQVGGDEDNKAMDANLGTGGDMIDARLRTRIPVKAGPHIVTATFARKNASATDEPLQPFTRDLDLQNMNGVPIIDYVEITGPYKGSGPGDTPSRRRIFSCKPAKDSEEVACARKILTTLARRAYRKPPSEADLETLLSYYQNARNKPGANFEAGIQNALRLMLASPKFLFRTESDPATVPTGMNYRVGDMDLASRLSFFLWSAPPDDELITLAQQGKLRDRLVFEAQVKRMIASPKADALVKNFAGQWLFLRNLTAVSPDPAVFPNFDDNLRQSFRRETELFFESVMRENRSVVDLLNADYTFVNERLAKHYGIPGIYGTHFRRVRLADDARRGLLGKGSTLLVTAYPTRTSPVLRGKWVLENILGLPAPAPPPNVPALKDNSDGTINMTLRQLMEQHRSNATCASCHRTLDPMGFVLENFDGVGAWRTREIGGPIDASGELADGTVVNGVGELRKAILRKPEQFVGAMTEKMLVYALGRGLDSTDMPVVRSIVKDASRSNYRFQSIVLGIVSSTPFRMRTKVIESGEKQPARREVAAR